MTQHPRSVGPIKGTTFSPNWPAALTDNHTYVLNLRDVYVVGTNVCLSGLKVFHVRLLIWIQVRKNPEMRKNVEGRTCMEGKFIIVHMCGIDYIVSHFF